ncbi:MAG: VWA domain-containing protein, partial [Candidatus Omnitrophica bacterium]|nr:VWA domain-containing protein [Candidatus Omnitrophota bacterium]
MEKSNRREFKTASTAFVVVVTSILLFAGLRTVMPTLGEPQAPVEITLELLDTTISEAESGDTEDAVTIELSGSVLMPESQTAEKLPETQEAPEKQQDTIAPDLKTLEEAVAQLKTSETPSSQLNEPTSAKPVRQEIFSEQAIEVNEADFNHLANQGIGQAYSGISTGQGKRGKESKVFDVLGQQVAEIHDISVVLVTDTSASISNENLERNYFQAIQVAIYLMHQEATRDKTVEYASYGTDNDTYKLLGFEQSRNLDAVNKSLAELQSKWGRGSSDFKQTLDAMARMFDGAKGKRKLIVFFTDASGLEKSQAIRYKDHYKKYGIDIAIVAVESTHAEEIPNSINLEEEIDAYSILQVILSIISTESKTGNLPEKLKDVTSVDPSLIKGARLAEGGRMFAENTSESAEPVVNITNTESSSQIQKFRIQAEKSRRLAQIRSIIWTVLIFTPLFLLIPIFAGTSYSDDPEANGEASVAVVDPQETAEAELDSRLKDAERLLESSESLSLLEQNKLTDDLLASAGILYEKFPDLQFRYEKRYQNAARQHAQLALKLALQNAEYSEWNQSIDIWHGNEALNFRIPESDLQIIASEILPEVIGDEARKINTQITAVESQISGGLVEIESLSGLLSDKKYLIHTELNSRVTGRSSTASGVDAGILDRMEMPLLADPEARMALLYHGYGSRYSETSENYFYFIDQESALKNAERVFISCSHLEGYLNRVQKREPADVTADVIRDKPKIHSEYDQAFRNGNEKLYQTLRADRFGYIYTMNRDPEFKTIASVGGSEFINGNVISVYELINKGREELKALGISRVA